jgi:multiple sugar transport system substrate-binding protein
MSTFSMGYDVTVLDQLGLEHPKETWTWSDFATLANEVRQKSGKKIYGAEDPSGDTASLQIFLRGKGEDLYKDGTLAFTDASLTEWFEYWAALRATGGTIPADIAAQAKYGDWPTGPLVKKQAALAHIQTPNLKGGFQDLTDHTIDITLPPRNTKDGKCGTFPAPSSFLSLNAKSQRADDAAAFINWFANGEEAAKTLRLISGPPASAKGRDVLLKGSDLSASEKQVLAYTDLALKNSSAPPEASPAASTAVADLLLKTSQDIAFKKISIQQGVPKFMADARKTLDGK